MGLAARKLTVADLRSFPVSGTGPATVGVVLELTDHVLAEDDLKQHFFGVWVHASDSALRQYFRGLRGHGEYRFPGSPGELADVVGETLRQEGFDAKTCTDRVTTLPVGNLNVVYWLFPVGLRGMVLSAMEPYNVLTPILANVRSFR